MTKSITIEYKNKNTDKIAKILSYTWIKQNCKYPFFYYSDSPNLTRFELDEKDLTFIYLKGIPEFLQDHISINIS